MDDKVRFPCPDGFSEIDYDKMNLEDVKNLLKQMYKYIESKQAEKYKITVKKDV